MSDPPAPPRRRWFRFSLLNLLLLIAVAFQALVIWRLAPLRESNQKPPRRNGVASQQLTTMAESLAGKWQEVDGSQWLDLASVDPQLLLVIQSWDDLPEYIRLAMLRLCDS